MLLAFAFSESVQSTVANFSVRSWIGQGESSLSVSELLNSYQSQVSSMVEQVARLKENHAEVVAILKRNSDGPMHEGFWKREAEEKEQEKKGHMYAEQIQDLKELRDKETDKLERRVSVMTQTEEAKMETVQSVMFVIRESNL